VTDKAQVKIKKKRKSKNPLRLALTLPTRGKLRNSSMLWRTNLPRDVKDVKDVQLEKD